MPKTRARVAGACGEPLGMQHFGAGPFLSSTLAVEGAIDVERNLLQPLAVRIQLVGPASHARRRFVIRHERPRRGTAVTRMLSSICARTLRVAEAASEAGRSSSNP